MGENSGISWTDDTFNPWLGCTKVSPACDGCYAEALMVMPGRFGPARVQWGAQVATVIDGEVSWDRKPHTIPEVG